MIVILIHTCVYIYIYMYMYIYICIERERDTCTYAYTYLYVLVLSLLLLLVVVVVCLGWVRQVGWSFDACERKVKPLRDSQSLSESFPFTGYKTSSPFQGTTLRGNCVAPHRNFSRLAHKFKIRQLKVRVWNLAKLRVPSAKTFIIRVSRSRTNPVLAQEGKPREGRQEVAKGRKRVSGTL